MSEDPNKIINLMNERHANRVDPNIALEALAQGEQQRMRREALQAKIDATERQNRIILRVFGALTARAGGEIRIATPELEQHDNANVEFAQEGNDMVIRLIKPATVEN